MNEGDWICADANCGNINFARRTSCYRCNKEKPDGGKPFKKKLGTEIGKSAAEKSRGLFNADDWQCNKCANVNWARRQTCNVCNAPKFGEVEARTGYGGGYNERGVVEYRRREPSSDDEFDEFGRRKRKRDTQSETSDKVGITEGPVIRKLPPSILRKGHKKEFAPEPAANSNENGKMSGSLSDGSVCDMPPLSRVAFRKNQLHNQTSYFRQDHMKPSYKMNSFESRKRHCSSGDREQTGSSGYDTGSKKSKRDDSHSPIIACNPVMENMVSSTNNEVVYKFTGPTPAEDFEVTYSVEERVKAAAFAIAYNNCKISTEKFEAIFDKPAPDFKTIFGWRQRLLTTGCLVDTHLDIKKDINLTTKPPPTTIESINLPKSEPKMHTEVSNKVAGKLPNPDEILISLSSDSEDDSSQDAGTLQKSQTSSVKSSRQRSASVETVVIGGMDTELNRPPSSVSTNDENASGARSNSRSTQQRTRSCSRESQDSNYPHSDSEKVQGKTVLPRNKKTNVSTKKSIQDSDSDSVSYNSDADDFLSRVYKEKKVKRKIKKQTPISTPVSTPTKVNNYDVMLPQNFRGYTTAKGPDVSPLTMGNIYTSNLRNMNIKPKGSNSIESEGFSNEYVPTKIVSTAKKSYQEFRDNVRKKGFWAKANGQSFSNAKQTMSNKPLENKIQNNQQRVCNTFYKINKPMGNIPITPIKPVENLLPALGNAYVDIKTTNTVSTVVCNKVEEKKSLLPKIHTEDNNNLHQSENQAESPLLTLDSRRVGINMQKASSVKNIESSKEVEKNQPPIVTKPYSEQNLGYMSASLPLLDDEFAKDNFSDFQPIDPYNTCNSSTSTVNTPKGLEDTSSVFDAVQSNSVTKNRSIMDIFSCDSQIDKSPEHNNKLNKFESVRKIFDTEWDEDDDALYGNSDAVEKDPYEKCSPPPSNKLYHPEHDSNDATSTPNKPTLDVVREKRDKLLDILQDFQTNRDKEISSGVTIDFMSQNLCEVAHIPLPTQNAPPLPPLPPSMPPGLDVSRPDSIPAEISDEIIGLSGACSNNMIHYNTPKIKSPSKRVKIIESIVIKPPEIHLNESENIYCPTNSENNHVATTESIIQDLSDSPKEQDVLEVPPGNDTVQPAATPQLDFSNLLAGINTNTLLLAIQNLQQLTKNSSNDTSKSDEPSNDNPTVEATGREPVEIVNLTNDEEWEKESNASIERQLEKMDGNTGDTPFLGDIFDPGPVVMPPNLANKLNVNLKSRPQNITEANIPHINENAPVIGNFKSFALPKPVILNRLKLKVKVPDNTVKTCKRTKRKKGKSSSAKDGEGEEDEDEEESGDEADLSKYDLWGSDAEQADANNEESTAKEGEGSKDAEKEKSPSPETKRSKRRSRSSSSSSTSSSSSSSSRSSSQGPKNKFDDFNLNSEREGTPRRRKSRSRSRSRSPRSRSSNTLPPRRKSRDSRSAGETRSRDRDRDRDRRERSRGKERRYSRDGPHFGARGRHR